MVLSDRQKSERHESFKSYLSSMGLYDKGSEHGAMIGQSVEELSETFRLQCHDAVSAGWTATIFNDLMARWLAKGRL